MDPNKQTAGPIVRDTNYQSPTYGTFIPNPAYTGTAIQNFDTRTGGTLGTQGSLGFGMFTPPSAQTQGGGIQFTANGDGSSASWMSTPTGWVKGGSVGGTIDASRIADGASNVELPNTPVDTNDYKGLGLAIPTSVGGNTYSWNGTDWGKNEVQPTGTGVTEETTAKDTQTKERKSYFDAIKEMFNKPKDEQAAREASGVNALNRQINELNNQIQTLQKTSAQQMIAQEDRLAPTSVISGAQGKIDRERTIKMLGLSAISQTLQGNLAIAQQNADDMVDMKYGPIETYLKYQKEALDMLEKDVTKEEARNLAKVKRQQELQDQAVADKKADEKDVNTLAMNALKNFPNDPAVVKLAQEAMTKGDLKSAVASLSKYQKDPLEVEGKTLDLDVKRAQLEKLNKEIADIDSTARVITNPEALKFAGAVQVILGSAAFTKEQKKALIASVNNGEDPRSVIKNQAKNIMGQTNATKLDNYETAKAQLDSIQGTLAKYYELGGKTNIFTGNYETAINKLGEVKDPQLVGLATQIASALQIYRNAVSGTAYSVQEGKDIASIFPGINKTQGLNDAILSGRKQAFDDTIDSMYSQTLGKSAYSVVKNGAKGELKDSAFVEKTLNSSNLTYEKAIKDAPAGQIGVINNQTGEFGYMPVEEYNLPQYKGAFTKI